MQMQQQVRADKQSGFTLIELMIVVTIIGVLASIAVPVYRDYTIRTRVSEAASVFAPVKAEMGLFYSERGTLPVGLTSMPRLANTPTSFAGEYVQDLDVGARGTPGETIMKMKNDSRLGDAGSETIVWVPQTTTGGGTIQWIISSDSSVPDRYLPSN